MEQHRLAVPAVVTSDVLRIRGITVDYDADGVPSIAVAYALGSLDAKNRFVERERPANPPGASGRGIPAAFDVDAVHAMAWAFLDAGGHLPPGSPEPVPEVVKDPEPVVAQPARVRS